MKKLLILALLASACSKYSNNIISPSPNEIINTDKKPGGSSAPTPINGPISLALSTWTNIGTPQPYPWSNNGSGIIFNFPSSNGLINYIYSWTGNNSPRSANGTITANITISSTGTPIFHWDNSQPPICNMQPFVVLFIWAHDLGAGEFDRWWAFLDKVDLHVGSFSVSSPTIGSHWLSVYGKTGDNYPNEFNSAINDINGIGMTFGGGCYYGHGVYVSDGSAQFKLNELRVN